MIQKSSRCYGNVQEGGSNLVVKTQSRSQIGSHAPARLERLDTWGRRKKQDHVKEKGCLSSTHKGMGGGSLIFTKGLVIHAPGTQCLMQAGWTKGRRVHHKDPRQHDKEEFGFYHAAMGAQ